jgi:hypothetical protein
MQRYLLTSVAFFLVTLSVAYAIPARPLYLPPEPPRPPVAPPPVPTNLAGTAWLGKYSTVNRIFILEGDGTVSYRAPASKAAPFKNRGTWRVEGNTLIFEHFVMEFRGVIQDANSIVGVSTLKTGAKTPQTLQRTTLDK